MRLEVEQNAAGATIRVEGDIDEAGAEELKKSFAGLDIGVVKEVCVDLGGVEVIGSSAIGKLLLFYKHLAQNDGRLVVRGLSPRLLELFRELKLDTLFTVSGR